MSQHRREHRLGQRISPVHQNRANVIRFLNEAGKYQQGADRIDRMVAGLLDRRDRGFVTAKLSEENNEVARQMRAILTNPDIRKGASAHYGLKIAYLNHGTDVVIVAMNEAVLGDALQKVGEEAEVGA